MPRHVSRLFSLAATAVCALGLLPSPSIADPAEERVLVSCPSRLKIVLESGKAKVLGPDGKQTVPYLIHNFYEGLVVDCSQPIPMRREEKWGYIGLNGRVLVEPGVFGITHFFFDGIAAVEQNGKWGTINTDGKFVVEPKYERITPLTEANGDVGVQDGEQWGIIARDGTFKVALRPGVYTGSYKGVHNFDLGSRQHGINDAGVEQPDPAKSDDVMAYYRGCEDGAKFISRDGLWGLAARDGREIFAPKYRAIHCFINGIVWVPDDRKRQWCAMGPDGALRDHIPCQPTWAFPSGNRVPDAMSDDPYESQVLWLRAFLDYGAGQRSEPPTSRYYGSNF